MTTVTNAQPKLAEQEFQRPETAEVEVEAGPGAMAQDSEKGTTLAEAANEQHGTTNPTGASSSEGSLAVEATPEEVKKQGGPPQEPESQRSKLRIALIMSALMVWEIQIHSYLRSAN